jgi:hypothetical protein
MVLESFGEVYTEQELRELCDCTYDSVFLLGGADPHPFKLKAAAQRLGFVNTKITSPSFQRVEIGTGAGALSNRLRESAIGR